jgi:hypothetical protein|tara:strand:+ start:345 stop:614 length:270 start_codon:yes stop_codon:yes gene_type:complete
VIWPTGETELNMPYIEKTGVQKIKEQLWQWNDVMHDPNIDGFNGWGCKQKIYEVLFQCQEYIDNAPGYAGEDEWLAEKKFDKAIKRIKG